MAAFIKFIGHFAWPWRLAMLLAIVVVGTSQASVTVGWKMPIERILSTGNAEDAATLEKAPGETAFFQPGDTLFDLSGEINSRIFEAIVDVDSVDPFAVPDMKGSAVKWKGEWAVWNSRSRMVIARGSWNDILIVEQALAFSKMPIVVRTQVDLSDAGKSRTLSLISRSDEKATFDLRGLKATVEAHTDTTPFSEIDCHFEISWPQGSQGIAWEVDSWVSLEDGHKLCLARQGSWQLFVTTTRELADGTPWREARWIEREGSLRAWSPLRWAPAPDRKQIDAKRSLGIYNSHPFYLDDPLKSASAEVKPDIEAPAELQEWARGPLMDVRKVLAERGIKCDGEGELAAYDPISDWCFVIADSIKQDMAESISMSVMDDREFVLPIWISTNPEAGGWGLASRSGKIAHIRRSGGNGGADLLFRAEPVQGGNGFTFDLGYSMDVVAGDAKIGRLESATTLTKDKPQLIGSVSASDGKEVKVTATVSGPPK